MDIHSTHDLKFEIVDLARATYRIHITEGVIFDCHGKPPRWLHRKFMWVFFGWRIEILDK